MYVCMPPLKLLHYMCVYGYGYIPLGWFSAQHKTRIFVESCVDKVELHAQYMYSCTCSFGL